MCDSTRDASPSGGMAVEARPADDSSSTLVGQLPFDSPGPIQQDRRSVFDSLRTIVRRRRSFPKYTIRSRRLQHHVYPSSDVDLVPEATDHKVARLAHRLSQQSIKQPDCEDSQPATGLDDESRCSDLDRQTFSDASHSHHAVYTSGVLDFLGSSSSIPTPLRIDLSPPQQPITFTQSAQTKRQEPRKRSHSHVSVEANVPDPTNQLRAPPRHRPVVESSSPQLFEHSMIEPDWDTSSRPVGDDLDLSTLLAYPDIGSRLRDGVLPYRRAADAAMQCPGLVRNEPRMRKRHKVKRKQARGDLSAQADTITHSNVTRIPTPT